MKAQERIAKKVIVTILLGMIVIVFTSHGFAQGTWEIKTPMSTARWGAASGVIDGNLYVVGGGSSAGSTNALEVYDPDTDTWTTKAPMPTVRGGVGAGVINGKLYVVGGANPGGTRLATLEVYDPDTDTWTTKASMPTARAVPEVVAIDGKLYVAGGCVGWCAPVTNVLQIYDPATNSWVTRASMPTGVAVADFAVENGLFYVMGGWAGWSGSNKVQVYNPVSNTWTTKTAHTGMGSSAAGSINGMIYVARYATSEVYDPATDTWDSFLPMPTHRSEPTSGVINDKLYVVGGHDSSYIALATLEVYDPFPNQPPEAKCKDVTVEAGSSCTASASIDDGSSDPDDDPITLTQSPSEPYPLGDTTVTLTVTDSKGASSQCTGTVTVVDNTSPALTCPAPQAIDATGSSGAVAIFTPTVSDNCSGPISGSCTPSSGSIFPIGATSVSCGATDGSGNSGTCGFTVTVRAAATQISNLITLVDSFNLPAGISASLDSKLSNAVTLLTAGNTKAACNVINAFINETSAQSGKKITTAQANQLITNALRIKAAAGCP